MSGQTQETQQIKTGTTTLGIVCKDGVVLAADKRATAGNFIANKNTEKVFPVSDNIAITIAGLVSDAQMLSKIFRAELKLKTLRSGERMNVKAAANLLAGMAYENIRKMTMVPGVVGFLLAGQDNTGNYLYEIGVDGSIFEQKSFVADGSGSVFAYGVLESSYKQEMDVQEGIELARKAVRTAMSRDSASGDGYDIYKVTKDGLSNVETVKLSYKE
ncbi:MAG: proteasome subunit beta [Candidatus Woesearchaeota archaeon]